MLLFLGMQNALDFFSSRMFCRLTILLLKQRDRKILLILMHDNVEIMIQ